MVLIPVLLIFVTSEHGMANENQDKITLQAIKNLRKQKLSQGIPFMINSHFLDPHQCFIEYPDGHIKIAEANSKECDFKIVFECTLSDSDLWRKRLKLI